MTFGVSHAGIGHIGDPCFYCNVPHDDVPVGPCAGRRKYPWGHPWQLGRMHGKCGMSRINPEFFKESADQMAYINGYDGNSP